MSIETPVARLAGTASPHPGESFAGVNQRLGVSVVNVIFVGGCV